MVTIVKRRFICFVKKLTEGEVDKAPDVCEFQQGVHYLRVRDWISCHNRDKSELKFYRYVKKCFGLY